MNRQTSYPNVKNNIITLYPKETKHNTWYIISMCLLFFSMIFHLLFSNTLNITGRFPSIWIILLLLSIVVSITNGVEFRSSLYMIIIYILSISMILNYLLYKNSIYIHSHIIFIYCFCFIIIYKTIKEITYKKHLKISLTLILLTCFLLTNYYIVNNRIIKDTYLNIQAKKALNISQFSILPVSLSQLECIDELSLKNVTYLNGIEYMKSLETLSIHDNGLILDYSPIANLSNLKTLSLNKVNLNILSDVDTIDNVNNLKIIYPENDSIKTLPLFPDVNNLTINFSGTFNLSLLKNFPNVREFSLCVEGPFISNGLEVINNLETLNLSYAYISNYNNLFDIPTLKNITLSNCNIVELDIFLQKANEKGISVTTDLTTN
ncbi:MAG: hypothetical protein RSA29_00995 [Clostridium sp.]